MIPEQYHIKDAVIGHITCLYCGSRCTLCTSDLVRPGHDVKPVWVCSQWPECDAWVGCIKPQSVNGLKYQPLGHPANAELRRLRIECHELFDKLWKHKKGSQYKNRAKAYHKLTKVMNLPLELCHIACFNKEQVLKAIQFLKEGKLE